MSIYQDNGYEDRDTYLQDLAETNGVPLDIVRELAFFLGENEDFDGLVTAVQEYEMLGI